MTDPNALYSSVAQASAAIVAILGGFVTSKVLDLAVRRRGIEEEIGDCKRELALARQESEEAWSAHENFRANQLISGWAEENLGREAVPDAGEARHRLRAEDIRQEEFDAAWQEFQSRVDRVGRTIAGGLKRYGRPKTSFDAWVQEHGIELADEDLGLAEMVYTRILKPFLARESKESARSEVRSSLEQ